MILERLGMSFGDSLKVLVGNSWVWTKYLKFDSVAKVISVSEFVI